MWHSKLITALTVVLLPVASDVQAQRPLRTEASADAAHQHGTDGEAAARVLRLARAAGAIRVDGDLADEAWSAAQPAGDFVQQSPEDGAPATQRTEVRVLADGRALYVAARLYDTAPDSIVAQLARRDAAVHADRFEVFLDGFHDRRTAFAFSVNAAGVKRDRVVTDEGSSDASWDAVWDAAVQRDSLGWTVELRIPLSQLRFHTAHSGEQPAWGLNFQRTLARRNETSYWAPVPRQAGRFVSLFGELRGLGAVESGARVEVTPYTVARVSRVPGDAADPFHRASDLFGAVGADVNVGLTRGFTLSATLNPDFGQVEADPSQVNLSDFELFLSERRPFFVEGAKNFRMQWPTWPPLFYSRRIGRAPQGFAPAGAVWSDAPTASTILGAAKLSGTTGDGWSVGVLSAVTAREEARYTDESGAFGRAVVEPLTSYTVARVARDFRGGRSGVGVMATATNRRLDDASLRFLHSDAYAMGIDARHRIGAYELSAGLIGSIVQGDTAAIARTQRTAGHYFHRPDADHVDYDPARTSLSGWSASMRAARTSGAWRWHGSVSATNPGLEISDLGFNPTLDEIEEGFGVGYHDYTPGKVLRRWGVSASRGSQRTFGGEVVEQTGTLSANGELLNYWGGYVWMMRHADAWAPDALRGGPALRKPGQWMGSVSVNSDNRRKLVAEAFVYGSAEDDDAARRTMADFYATLRPSSRLDLSIGPSFTSRSSEWQYVTRRTFDGAPVYLLGRIEQTTVAAVARLNYTFSPDLSLQFYARPFVSAGRYGAFKRVADPRARDFDARFHTFAADEIRTEQTTSGRTYRVDLDADGAADVAFGDPDFNSRALQMNAVMRWEYRPGSTVFLVWSHGRNAFDREAFRLGRDLSRMWEGPQRNVLLVKASYWLGR